MNSKTLLAVYTIFAALSGVALTGSINSSTIAFADKPNDPDCFGDSASDLGGDLGEHSRDGSDDVGDHAYDSDGKAGREGIGNVGGKGSETHPSDLAGALGGDCDE